MRVSVFVCVRVRVYVCECVFVCVCVCVFISLNPRPLRGVCCSLRGMRPLCERAWYPLSAHVLDFTPKKDKSPRWRRHICSKTTP